MELPAEDTAKLMLAIREAQYLRQLRLYNVVLTGGVPICSLPGLRPYDAQEGLCRRGSFVARRDGHVL